MKVLILEVTSFRSYSIRFFALYSILTFLCSMHLNEFFDPDKFQWVVDFGRSFCFS